MAAVAATVFGNPLTTVVATAVGSATGGVLRPVVQDIENELWSAAPVKPPAYQLLADGVAQGQVDPAWAAQRAKEQGISNDAFNRLVDIANVGPGASYAFELWRRGLIGAGEFATALKRMGLEPAWVAPLEGLRDVLLSPEELAAARVKGHIDAGRQYSESALQGITQERAEIMYQTTGNPPGPETLQTMFNRHVIDRAAFTRGILQGNIRPEWDDELFALRERLLTPAEIVNLRLRGWTTDAEMYADAAELGFTQERTHQLFLGQGRPISFRQVFIGERRGGTYDGPTGHIDPAILKSLQESNIRPEWYNLADAQKESYPSAFVLRSLAQNGDLDAEQTRRVLMEIGWPVWLVDAVVPNWTGGTSSGDTPAVKSARTQAVSEIRAAYLIGQADAAQAQTWLNAVGVDAPSVAGLLPIWDVMREVPQRGLTATQIKTAYRRLTAQWPRDRALAELQLAGYTLDDAATILDE